MGIELYPTTPKGNYHSQVKFARQTIMDNILLRIISSAQGDSLLHGQGGQEVCGAEGDLVYGSWRLTFGQVWGLLYTNTMVRVELGSGLDQRSRLAILAYIGSGHRSDVQTPTTSLRFGFLLPYMPPGCQCCPLR